MAPRKRPKEESRRPQAMQPQATIAGSGLVVDQPITETLEQNYMPYAMSVIVSRAIPEIDGFKPAHRKLLYTMYKMGLLTRARTKSANIVGRTMQLNPHGDQAIYDTLVRMSRGYEALLHPYVDSKGNFGKFYSRDMASAASRYTEAKLEPIAAELFRDIDKDTVDMVDNYDGTLKEPALLPTTFPAILVNSNVGIAVGMASSICPFNLEEVCETAIALIREEDHDLFTTLRAPDFPGGGRLLYNEAELRRIYETGRGGVRVRARYRVQDGRIEITEIPPSTTVEAIIDKIVELVKGGRIREIGDLRDETDKNGLMLTLDLKRGTDPDKLMQKLYRMTPLEDTFSCNFNVLIGGSPRVMGVRELLGEWTAFRVESVKRRIYFDLTRKQKQLHLLRGLERILLDIDKAIRIVRETEEEADVVPNLMIGFGIDAGQAEYVAEIRLRQLNREYILKRTAEVESLAGEIAEMQATLESPRKIKAVIVAELREVIRKYKQPRKTEILYAVEEDGEDETQDIPDYPVHLFLTREGNFKKITPQSLRMSGEHKLKEGDAVAQAVEANNADDLLFFTSHHQVYKSNASEFADTKASVLGDYLPAKLGMEEGETVLMMAVTRRYDGFMLFAFENGKVAKVEMKAYETKTRRRKLLSAYSDKSPYVAALQLREDGDILLTASSGRKLLVHSGVLTPKNTKDTQGVAVMTIKKGHRLIAMEHYTEGMLAEPHRHRAKNLPAAGMLPRERSEQLELG